MFPGTKLVAVTNDISLLAREKYQENWVEEAKAVHLQVHRALLAPKNSGIRTMWSSASNRLGLAMFT